ncbi:rhodanese-like domain-containing protein [Erythrobacter sp. CCH5-A1]|jgi:rhodanese-related sulfurtransferase|uniref:rhodanese-like domain-containing protein n=1 Tax=Erythrobacter sp. CCH5-A1 TaxID=1768792 RepID=UPI000835CF98|nr:rhodanese-like domain-containing protein [Erythrobacter sp. CCH5-A1]
MRPGRAALFIAPALLLALSACGGDGGESKGKRDAPSIPLGFELAFAGTAGEAEAAPAPAALVPLSPEQLAAKIAAGNVRLIDVRTDEEVAEGMIPGAEHIALDRFDPAKLDLSDGREVVLYCRSGRRSAIAGERLAAVTGQPAEHLEGGMLAWEAAGQPVEPPQGQ